MKRSSSTNQFNGGLVMDLNPIVTPNNVLTDALNATIITNNGNENALQNDMGNGRVETAFLPEGYIPVGSCEFGDIIYIASYNPLINKCQLGCFPSPQRIKTNSSVTSVQQKIDKNDFQYFDGEQPTGRLKQSTLTKIIYENNLQAGDKYIISAQGINNEAYLTDLGNTSHVKDSFPRFYKISVVNVQEDGKIERLTNGLKWYTKNQQDYFLNNTKIDRESDLDIDAWRSAVSSAYCIFSSKISGKLALLIELEKITNFSCTWGIDNISEENEYTNIPIYFSFNWESENKNVNPSGIILCEGKWIDENNAIINDNIKPWINGNNLNNENCWSSEISRSYKPEDIESFNNYKSFEELSEDYKDINQIVRNGEEYHIKTNNEWEKDENDEKKLKLISLDDDVVNNTFKYPVKKSFTKFKFKTNDDLKGKYYYKIAPYMPYGVLEELASEGIIDFSKIGKNVKELTYWKYYNQEGYSTLTWGLEVYNEPNRIVPYVYFEFYDDKGLCAVYKSSNKDSYNGVFQSSIMFGTNSTDLSNKDSNNKLILHQGSEISTESLTIQGQTFLYVNKDNALNSEYVKKDLATQTIYTELKQGYVSISEYGTIILQENDNNILADLSKPGDRKKLESYKFFENDSGILYADSLYYVKIVVPYAQVGPLGDYEFIKDKETKFYRWFWTNKMFNDYYFGYSDFKELPFELNLDVGMTLESTNSWKYDKKEEINSTISGDSGNTDISAIKQVIYSDGKRGNLNIKINPGLSKDNSYNFVPNGDKLNLIKVELYLPDDKNSSTNNPEQPSIKFSDYDTNINKKIYPEFFTDDVTGNNINNLSTPNMENYFKLENVNNIWTEGDDEITYIDSDLNEVKSLIKLKYEAKEDEKENKVANLKNSGIDLNFIAIHYSKYYNSYKTIQKDVPIIRSFIFDDSDFNYYNLDIEGRYFNKFLYLGFDNPSNGRSRGYMGIIEYRGFNNNKPTSNVISSFEGDRKSHDGQRRLIEDTWKKLKNNGIEEIKEQFPFIFSYIWAQNKKWDNENRLEGSITISPSKNNNTHLLSRSNNINNYNHRSNPECFRGDVGCINSDGQLYISDMRETDRAIKIVNNNFSLAGSQLSNLKYISPDIDGARTYSFLLNCFYKTTETRSEDVTLIDNYVYLDNNYSQFKQDLVVRVLTNSGDVNDFIWFINKKSEASSFQNYINNLKFMYGIKNNEQEIELHNNVILQLKSIQKTFPIILQVPYIQPDIKYDNNNVVSLDFNEKLENKEELQQLVNKIKEFENNKIYCFGKKNGKYVFEQLNDGIVLTATPQYASTSSKQLKFTVNDQFIRRLSIFDGRMKFNSNPATSYNYIVQFGNKWDEDSYYDVPGKFFIFKNA